MSSWGVSLKNPSCWCQDKLSSSILSWRTPSLPKTRLIQHDVMTKYLLQFFSWRTPSLPKTWLIQHKAIETCTFLGLSSCFLEDLLPNYNKLSPRRSIMVKYSQLATMLLAHARNGVLSHVTTKKAIEDLIALNPALTTNVNKVLDIILELSRSLRTLLGWFRDYVKYASTRKVINKHLKSREVAILQNVAKTLVLTTRRKDMYKHLPWPWCARVGKHSWGHERVCLCQALLLIPSFCGTTMWMCSGLTLQEPAAASSSSVTLEDLLMPN